MKKLLLILPLLIIVAQLSGQTIPVSDKLSLTKLTDRSYMHTCENNNGLVFINGDKALIISTPESKSETQNLIDWVRKEQKATIIAYVIDRWHPDAMGGLAAVRKNGIQTYSYELTRQIAKQKGLPVPQTGFDPKTEIQVGNEIVICHYLGEAHTRDGIVVYIPGEQILFGGNEIRNFNGWAGNIADAHLDKWSETATRIKNEYGKAKIVIPGHGSYGGPELIDYTIDLYKSESGKKLSGDQEFTPLPSFIRCEDFIIEADSDSTQNGVRVLKNATVIVQDSSKYAVVKSPSINYKPDRKRIDTETGRVQIYDKTPEGGKLRTDVSFNRLLLYKVDDQVGLRIILREIAKE